MTEVIGLTGVRGAGKDTAAAVLPEHANIKLAGTLKQMLKALLEYQGASEEIIWRMLEGDLKEEPSPLLAGRSPRHAMQTLGTEWGRDLMGADFWVKIAERRISLFPKSIVTDVRFQNEVEMIRRIGGKVYRVERVGQVSGDLHPSERLVMELDVDGILENDGQSIMAFQGAASRLLN